jgi:TetR/AcrR family transcriptional repressor of uid operon
VRKVDQAKYDEKRRRILNAAHGCFRRDGFRGASIGDICEAAHMSPGHLYHYFDSKEAIIKALIEVRLEQETAFFAELAQTADLVTALSMSLDRRLKKLRADGFSLLLEMSAESARNPSIAAIVRRAERGTEELLSALIREAQGRGHVDPTLDPDMAATIIANIVFGLNQLAVVRDPTFDLNAAADTFKLLTERFLRPRATRATKRVRHPERKRTEGKMCDV